MAGNDRIIRRRRLSAYCKRCGPGARNAARAAQPAKRLFMSELKRYTVWLFETDGESAGIDRVIDTSDDLDALRLSYWQAIIQYSDRLIMVCDRAIVLARSDRREMMP